MAMAELDWYLRAHLKPRHLQLLVALDELRHVGRVAARLHVTQPAVSLALGEMEKGLGLKLFERTPKGVLPNAYGECLIRQARVMLGCLDRARDELRALQTGATGEVSVGALPAVTPGLLPQALALHKQQSPRNRVVVLEGSMDALLPQLQRGQIDLIVGRLATPGTDTSLGELALYDGFNAVVAGPRHPLARRKRLSWADLGEFPWVMPPAGSLSREPLESMLQHSGCPMPADIVETQSIHVITGYLHESRAIGLLSRMVARHYERAGLLAVLPLSLPDPLRPIGVTWSLQRPLSAAARALMDCLKEKAVQLAL